MSKSSSSSWFSAASLRGLIGHQTPNQSMFEPALREVVLEIDGQLEAMIWRVVSRYAALAGKQPALDSSTCFGMLDGLFAQSLLAWATGPAESREEALAVLTGRVDALMPSLLA